MKAWLAERWRDPERGWREILETYVMSRFALVLVGMVALGRLPWGHYSPTYNVSPRPWIVMWIRWDALWYLHIARYGYDRPDALAFFPAYPMLVRFAHLGLGLSFPIAALVVSNGLAIGFLFAFWALLADYFPQAVRSRALYAAVAFPSAFFLSAAYTESTFLFFAIMVFLLAKRRRFWWAGAFAFGAALTRNEGVFTVVPILWQYYRAYGLRVRWELASVMTVPLAILGFMAFQWRYFGNPLAFVELQSAWGRHITWPFVGPWLAVKNIWSGATLQPATVLSMIDLSSGLASAALWVYSLRKLPGDWMAFWAILWLVDVSAPNPYGRSPLLSMSRLVLVLFPAFAGLGVLTENSSWRRLVNWLFPLLQAIFFTIFATWHWIA